MPGVVLPTCLCWHRGVMMGSSSSCLEGCDTKLVVWVTKVLWDLAKISPHLVLYSYTSPNISLGNCYGVMARLVVVAVFGSCEFDSPTSTNFGILVSLIDTYLCSCLAVISAVK